MLVVEVELLGGRYVATAHDDRRRAEWPPHPARFYSALVAALHDAEPPAAVEEAALRWLECQPPPALELPEGTPARRDVHDVYVPVNDVTVLAAAHEALRKLDDAEAALTALSPAEPKKLLTAALKARDKLLDQLNARLADAGGKASAVDLKAGAALLPDRRTRQVRAFPSVTPPEPVFAFVWPTVLPAELQAGFDAVLGRVTRLGHASSLVRCARVERAAQPTLVPVDAAPLVLRVVGPGQLERLRAAHARHEGVELRVLPARPQCYAAPKADQEDVAAACGVFSPQWIVYQRCGGARLRASRGPELARALRAALLEAGGAGAPLPPALCGHDADGRPTAVPHLAFVACPDVGHEHADGGVLGCAIVLPAGLTADDRRTLMRRLAAWEAARGVDGVVELAADGLPPVRLRRVELSERWGLRPDRWCQPSRSFVTATPVALDRHPGNLRSNLDGTAHRAAIEAQRCIAEACVRIGLPRPEEVEVSLSPLATGTQPGGDFRGWAANVGRAPRVRVHARLRFAQPVAGPVLLGAGRHYGLGLCMPVAEGGGA